jgi:hypothetical protein
LAQSSDDFFAPPTPSGWYFSGNALFAWRSAGDDGAAVIASYPKGLGPAVYSAGGSSPGPRFGGDLRLGYDSTNGWGVEGRYFGGFRWTGATAFTAPPEFVVGEFGQLLASNLTATLNSNLDTVELNGRHYLKPNVLLIAGLRAMQFDDAFSAIDPPAPINVYRFDTQTSAIGPQVGGQYKYSFLNSTGGEIAYINAEVRGGVLFENNTDAFTRTTNGSLTASGGATGSTASGFVEAGITVGHRLARYSIEGGYRIFYLNRVPTGEAYAADALAAVSESNAPVYTSLIVQALTFGLKITF